MQSDQMDRTPQENTCTEINEIYYFASKTPFRSSPSINTTLSPVIFKMCFFKN